MMEVKMLEEEKMNKKMLIGLFLSALIIISGCGVSKIGKTCTTECIKEERVCESTKQECVEKNFWGNCVEFEEGCARWCTKCVTYDEVCR